MKISNNWLEQFIKTDISLDLKSEILTDLGLEVEGISDFEPIKGGLKGIVIGKVIECRQHPNADKLKLTLLNIGNSEPIQVVCGAPNVRKGINVAVALVGSKLYDLNEIEYLIKKSKIRGEYSYGMICSEMELNIGNSHDGIIELEDSLLPGTLFSSFFDIQTDNVIEIGLTPNRADAMSHMGVARDLRASLIQKNIEFNWNTPSTDKFVINNNSRVIVVNVKDKIRLKKYFGITISNVSISNSNNTIINRLKAIGIKPKNNIVDITNYVLHELGQPIHAFDADKISGEINVRTLDEGTIFKALDGNEIKLSSEDLMICDDSKPLCLAGIIGGINSGIDSSTKNIFLESANFDPISIRKSAKRHNINTDSSFRFERGVDPEIGIYALKRAASMIQEFSGGDISSNIQEYSVPIEKKSNIFLNFKKIKQIIGHEIHEDILIKILSSLEIEIVSVVEDGFSMKVPSYRVDVIRECDVIEEILRVYGFSNIKPKTKLKTIYPIYKNKNKNKLHQVISDLLINHGFYEVINNPLINPKHSKLSSELNSISKIRLLNPLGPELSELRSSLLFSILEVISFNVKRQQKKIKIFENGTIYSSDNNNYLEEKSLAIAITGNTHSDTWNSKAVKSDFFNLKGIVDLILKRINIYDWNENNIINDYFTEGLTYYKNEKKIVSFGLITKTISDKFSIDLDVLYAEFNINFIIENSFEKDFKLNEISRFPSSKRDFSLLLDKNIPYNLIEKLAFEVESKILEKIELFDVFEGNTIPDGKKSYGVSFYFTSINKTLTDKNIDKVMNKLKNKFSLSLNAELR